MVLKHDCVRDTMLYLENNLTLNGSIDISEISLKNHSFDDIQYTCKKLYEAGFIKARFFTDGGCIITDITYNGHTFLDTIRDNSVWKATKSKISKIASVSLPTIQSVASSIILQKLGI